MKEQTIGFFAKHMVCLGWMDQTPGKRASTNNGSGEYHNATGFVISVNGEWFLFTAGHVLEDIEFAREQGQILNQWHLDDTAGLNAQHTNATY